MYDALLTTCPVRAVCPEVSGASSRCPVRPVVSQYIRGVHILKKERKRRRFRRALVLPVLEALLRKLYNKFNIVYTNYESRIF